MSNTPWPVKLARTNGAASLKKIASFAALFLILAACNLPLSTPPPTRTRVPATARAPASSRTPASTSEGVVETKSDGTKPEAIVILEPGPGSRLRSPLRVAGVADPTHEQTLVLRGLRPDGSELIAPHADQYHGATWAAWSL